MTKGKRAGLTVAVAIAMTGALALLPSRAEAHGRRGGHVVVVGGFYHPWAGYGPFWGWGWGGGWGWGPYPWGYYGPQGGVDMNYAMMTGFGAVDLNVKPNRADVWVDGKYVGEARDLDGYPSYLWLADGAHKLAVYKGGYKTFEEEISVNRGVKTELKIRLEPGESQPPGPMPTGKSAEEKHTD